MSLWLFAFSRGETEIDIEIDVPEEHACGPRSSYPVVVVCRPSSKPEGTAESAVRIRLEISRVGYDFFHY